MYTIWLLFWLTTGVQKPIKRNPYSFHLWTGKPPQRSTSAGSLLAATRSAKLVEHGAPREGQLDRARIPSPAGYRHGRSRVSTIARRTGPLRRRPPTRTESRDPAEAHNT